MEKDLPLKRRLVERLGGIVESSTDVLPQKGERFVYCGSCNCVGLLYLFHNFSSYDLFIAQKPVRERLGLTAAPSSTDSEPKSSGDIRIKTLEEIRQEKATRNLDTCKVVRVVKEVPAKKLSPSKKSLKPTGGPQVKTFSETLYEKKKMQGKKAQEVSTTARSPERNEGPSTAGAAVKAPVAAAVEVRVKTLEEIRREKAARMQAQLQETTDDKIPTSTEAESSGLPKRRILRINKSSCKSDTFMFS